MKKKNFLMTATILCGSILASHAQVDSKTKWGWGLDVAASLDSEYGDYIAYIGAQRLYSPCKYVTLGIGASLTKTRTTEFTEMAPEGVMASRTHRYYLDNDGGKSSIYNVNALGTVMFTLPIYKNTGVFCDATGILALPYNRNVKMIKVERDEPYTSTKIQDRVFNKCAPGIFGEFGVYQDFNLSNDHNMRIALGYGYGSYNPLKGYENAGFDGYSIPIQNYNKQQLNRLTVKILFLY